VREELDYHFSKLFRSTFIEVTTEIAFDNIDFFISYFMSLDIDVDPRRRGDDREPAGRTAGVESSETLLDLRFVQVECPQA